MDIDDWYLTFISDYPEQARESVDCGIFLMKACECIALKKPFTFSQSNMASIWTKMVVEFLKKPGIKDDQQWQNLYQLELSKLYYLSTEVTILDIFSLQ